MSARRRVRLLIDDQAERTERGQRAVDRTAWVNALAGDDLYPVNHGAVRPSYLKSWPYRTLATDPPSSGFGRECCA